MNGPLRAGIVGGGHGAFIGAIHRMAAELDGHARLVAGAMSSHPTIAGESAASWNLLRSYTSYAEMAQAEPQRQDKIDFVIVATPNHLHLPVALAFLRAGIHVICDKPLALNAAEGQLLTSTVQERRALFALTHNYTGYPAVQQARAMVRSGAVGQLRKVMVEYVQDWLMEPLEQQDNKQASWRMDPTRAGMGGCIGDIGTHAVNLLEFISGLKIRALCADLSSFVAGRVLDDDANILLRLEQGAKGTLSCSQIACGEDNSLNIRLYGTKAGLEWHQSDPNALLHKPAGRPCEVLRAGHSYLDASARALSRTPPGHPEGFIEAFANIYRHFIADIRRFQCGDRLMQNYPSAEDGLRGLQFIGSAVECAGLGSHSVEL